MKDGFRKLFGVELSHEYYKDGVGQDLACEPTEECAKILRGHRLLFIQNLDGFEIVYNYKEDSAIPYIPISTDIKFSFVLKLQNPKFLNFTKISRENGFILHYSNEDSTDSLPYKSIRLYPKVFNYSLSLENIKTIQLKLYNSNKEELLKESLQSKSGVFEKQYDFQQIAPGNFVIQASHNNTTVHEEAIYVDSDFYGQNVFGLIELSNINSKNEQYPRIYKIHFKSKKVSWKYYVSVQRNYDDYVLALEDKGNGGNKNRYSNIDFSFCERPNDNTLDNKTLLFESGSLDKDSSFQEQKIPYYEENKQNLQIVKYHKKGKELHEGDHTKKDHEKREKNRKNDGHKDETKPKGKRIVVIDNLPNPSVQHIKPEVFIYI